ncbi:GNAT family N-acetyltransferase [Oerskovia sp. M15]
MRLRPRPRRALAPRQPRRPDGRPLAPRGPADRLHPGRRERRLGLGADHGQATAWWSAFLADPDHRTWVGRDDSGRIVATASLALTSKANGTHRAEVVKLLVHRQARGNKFAPGLMATIERFAKAENLSLLTLDTETGSLAESLYRRWGWTEVGAVPGFAEVPGGARVSTTIFYKQLGAR